ncbi:hypothetical protein FGB62_25g171 [Gracilaria domingensis]|nr:hypothetical protein FGB62_25g171 [Gracilaria domingensis]
MGNSLSCFERVSEHPPYSWPKDHPDRERAIAERKRARHNMKLAQKQVHGRTGAQEVKPEPAAAPQPKADSKEVVEAAPATEKPVEEPKVAEVSEKEAPDEIVKTGEPVDAAAGAVEETLDEVQEDVTVDRAVEEVTEKELVATAEEITSDPKEEAVSKEPEEPEAVASAIVEETPKVLEEEEPVEEKKEEVEVDPEVVDEVAPIEAVGKVEDKEEEVVEEIVKEKEADEDVVAPANVDDEEPVDRVPEIEPVDKETEVVPVEEPMKKEMEEEATTDDVAQEEPPAEEDYVPTTPTGPDGVVKEVKEDIADEELPSIDSRRAMFDTTEDELPKPSEVNRDVFDAASNEYITLEEYRRRQRERAQGLVKERLEKFEEIDEEVSKEKAELAAIVAARNVAQQTADWAYKQQPENAKSPTKDSEGAVKEVMSPIVPLSPSTGSVAGISARFEADGADTLPDNDELPLLSEGKSSSGAIKEVMSPILPLSPTTGSVARVSAKFEADGADVLPGNDELHLISETKEVSPARDVDAVDAPVEPKEMAEAVEDVLPAESDVAAEATEKVEALEGATAATPDIVADAGKGSQTVADSISASMEDVAGKSTEIAEKEGNTIQVPQVSES